MHPSQIHSKVILQLNTCTFRHKCPRFYLWVSFLNQHLHFHLPSKCLCKSASLQKQSPSMFCKKVVLRNFGKFTGKHLRQSLFFNKVTGPRPPTLLKKRLWHRCFLVNFVKFPRTRFYIEHPWWLLLSLINHSVREKPQLFSRTLTQTLMTQI